MDVAFGDYPHYLPGSIADHLKDGFKGWMLLNYKSRFWFRLPLVAHANNNAAG